jgi:branched-chain amino acid transport system ATP-binding protein
MKPRLLLLDEPAAGMNPGEISALMDLIRWVKKQFGVTIWIIEHQMRVIMGICDRIKVIDFGKTIAEGTPSEIRNNPSVIEAYLGEEVV